MSHDPAKSEPMTSTQGQSNAKAPLIAVSSDAFYGPVNNESFRVPTKKPKAKIYFNLDLMTDECSDYHLLPGISIPSALKNMQLDEVHHINSIHIASKRTELFSFDSEKLHLQISEEWNDFIKTRMNDSLEGCIATFVIEKLKTLQHTHRCQMRKLKEATVYKMFFKDMMKIVIESQTNAVFERIYNEIDCEKISFEELFLFQTMATSENPFIWSTDSMDVLNQMCNVNYGDAFKSHPFCIDNIEFVMQIFPNGDAPTNIGCFVILLQPVLIPSAWSKIVYRRTIQCKETQCSNLGISWTLNDKFSPIRPTGWMDETMKLEEFKNIIRTTKRITFVIEIKVLEIKLTDDQYHYIHKPIELNGSAKNFSFEWKMNYRWPSRYGQCFESQIFDGMWSINLVHDKKNEIKLWLQLCALPQFVKSMDINCSIRCVETKCIKRQQNVRISYDAHNQNVSMGTIFGHEHIQNIDTLTFQVSIQILDIYHYTEANQAMALKENIDNRQPIANELLFEIINIFNDRTPKYERQTSKIHELKQLVSCNFDADILILHPNNEEDEAHLNEIWEYLDENQRNKNFQNDVEINCINSKKWIPQRDALKVVTIESNERNPNLNGEKGLIANIDIPTGTILGQYFGREFLENEFDDIYGGTKEWIDINKYAMHATVEVALRHSELSYFTNIDMWNADDYEDESVGNELINQEFRLVIDGIQLEVQNAVRSKLIYMNDCRLDICMTSRTEDDKREQNVKFCTFFHNGWPEIFVVAIRDIHAGDEILTYYGEQHVGWEQDKRRYQMNQKLKRQKVEQLLKKHNVKI